MNRKKTPDILSSLMGGERKKEENNWNAQHLDVVREKATFNLSKKITSELEEFWMEMRKILYKKKKISKTEIVEKALEKYLKEFRERKTDSDFSELFQ
jgi:hypothetical protein